MKLLTIALFSTLAFMSLADEILSDFGIKPHILACRRQLNLSREFVKNLKNGDISGNEDKAKVNSKFPLA